MIDIHSHLLPGVDDGSRSLEQSLAVLQRFVQEGVKEVVLTPHLRASRANKAPVAKYREKFADLVAAAPAGIRLHLGFEIMLDAPGVDLTADGLSLGGSNAVLVEFAHQGVPPNHLQEIYRIRASGLVPVIAHPERYPNLTVEDVESWKDAGAATQVDAGAPLGRGPEHDMAVRLLEAGLVDLFAADNHGDEKTLAGIRRWLLDQRLDAAAELLTSANAGALLKGEPLAAVPAFRPADGWLARLKSALSGRH